MPDAAPRVCLLALDADDLDSLDKLAAAKGSTLDAIASAVLIGYARAAGPRWHAAKPPLGDG